VCAHRAAARAGEYSVAWLGTFLLAVSPMLTFTSATSLSQEPSLAASRSPCWDSASAAGAAVR